MWLNHSLWFWLAVLVVGAIGVVMLVVVGFFPLLVLTARFERIHIRRLVPLEDKQGPASRNATAAELADSAIENGLFYVGAFRDEESNLVKARVDLYLNGDGSVLLLIPSMTKTMGYRLLSRMADDVWLMTSETSGNTDLSGLRLDRMLPGCEFFQLLRYHHDRLESYPAEVDPMMPETLIRDLRDHDQMRGRRAVELGMARWVSERQDCYTATWRGAFKTVRQVLTVGSRLDEANRLAESYKSGSGPSADL